MRCEILDLNGRIPFVRCIFKEEWCQPHDKCRQNRNKTYDLKDGAPTHFYIGPQYDEHVIPGKLGGIDGNRNNTEQTCNILYLHLLHKLFTCPSQKCK